MTPRPRAPRLAWLGRGRRRRREPCREPTELALEGQGSDRRRAVGSSGEAHELGVAGRLRRIVELVGTERPHYARVNVAIGVVALLAGGFLEQRRDELGGLGGG